MVCTTFSASEIVLIITGTGGAIAAVLMALKNSLKRSSCCGGTIDFENGTPSGPTAV